uniref:Palmitoyltransferase n=1 Tax=Nothoprocta perdicaria TaxID=30464 RepID=A0A8C6ZLS6_NOTPE
AGEPAGNGRMKGAAGALVLVLSLLLNVVAPAYFLDPSATSLLSPALLHGALFLFLSANALGNYVLVIQSSPEDLGKGLNLGQGTEVVADWLDGSRSPGSALPSTHFCRLCARVTQRHDHHCFFTGNCIGSRNMRNFIMFCLYTSLACLHSLVTGMAYISVALSMSFANPLAFLTLLPHSISQFFSGKDLFLRHEDHVPPPGPLGCEGGLALFPIMLLILRGQTRYQVRKGMVVRARPWRQNLREVFGKRWLLGLVIPVLNVGSDNHRQKEK